MITREDLSNLTYNIEEQFNEALQMADILNTNFNILIYKDGKKILDFNYNPDDGGGLKKENILAALETGDWISWSETKRIKALRLLREISERADEYWESSSSHC